MEYGPLLLLHDLAMYFADANLALHLFDEAQTAQQEFAAYEYSGVAREDTRKEVMPAVPGCMLNRAPHMHSRSFLYALDNIHNYLQILSKMAGVPPAITDLKTEFEQVFGGNLKPVRNSAHHPEDRVRGLKTNEKPIDIQPSAFMAFGSDTTSVHTGSIGGPGIANEVLRNGNRYGGLLADGTYGEVEVSAATMAACQDVLQQVFDAFIWTNSDFDWVVYPYHVAIMGKEQVAAYANAIKKTVVPS
jgi:hypothetical protein